MPALSAAKADSLSEIRSKLPPPSIIIKLSLLVTSLVFSVWLLNAAVYSSDYLYTYLGEVIENMEQPEDLYFIKNLIPASSLEKNRVVRPGSRTGKTSNKQVRY